MIIVIRSHVVYVGMIMSKTEEMSHKHYIYSFGETLCRMNIKIADSPMSCISSDK